MTLAPLQAATTVPAPQAPRIAGTPAPAAVSSRDLAPQKFTAADIQALKIRKGELSDLLNNVTRRRKEVQTQLRGAQGADRAGLEARLGVLDARIARLETEIDENSGQLASLDAARTLATTSPAATEPRSGRSGDFPVEVVGFFVFVPIAIAIARNIWRRGSRAALPATTPDTARRLERMEQAMEAIAIEVERVSEGQRFITRLMSGGAAQPVAVPQPELEPAYREPGRIGEQR